MTAYHHTRAKESRQTLARELGVSLEALETLVVGVGFDEYRGLWFTTWPERDAQRKVTGIVRRYRDGAKKTMRHSSHGLYFGSLDMPGPVCLPEGGSDTAALVSLGVNVIGRPSNTGGIDLLLSALRRCRKPLVVLGEDDRKQGVRGVKCAADCGGCMQCWPGRAGARLTAQRLCNELRNKVSVRYLPGAKDSRDWLRKNPTATAIEFLKAIA